MSALPEPKGLSAGFLQTMAEAAEKAGYEIREIKQVTDCPEIEIANSILKGGLRNMSFSSPVIIRLVPYRADAIKDW